MMLRDLSAGLLMFCLPFLSTNSVAETRDSRAVLTGVTYFVDDDAPNDPGPNDPTISDPLEDGSTEHPFDLTQEAIDGATSNDCVKLLPGVYHEDVVISSEGMTIMGSGRSVTEIRSLYADISQYDFTIMPRLSVSGLTIQGPDFTVYSSENPWQTSGTTVTLENVDILALQFLVYGSGGLPEITMTDVRLSSSHVYFESTSGHLTAILTRLFAPASLLSFHGAAGGTRFVTIRDSVVGGILTGSLDDRFVGLLNNVHFMESGVDTRDPNLSLSISDCVFDQGGVAIPGTHSPDSGTDSHVEVSRSIFKKEGISFGAHFGPKLGSYDELASLKVDACTFLEQGLRASIMPGLINPLPAGGRAEIGLAVTNSLFISLPFGIWIQNAIDDPEPDETRVVLQASIVSNTFAGCETGIRIDTNPHAPGLDSIASLLANNIIQGGRTGIEIHGTDDQHFTIAGNNVYGNATGDYLGDLSDQTGLNGNISADPLFADANAHDFYLTPANPCVDAGTAGTEIPTVDHDGTVRPQDGDGDRVAVPDIGAFEFTWIDEDGDGFPAGEDCNDNDSSQHPGAAELPGNVVDEDCSGAAACDPSAFWKNHGQFVSCVVRACGTLVATGSATRTQCDALVSNAAHSSVGRRQRLRQPPVPHAP